MKALGNSSSRRLSRSQRDAVNKLVKQEVQKQYDREIDNAENFGKFFTTIAACEVLEEEFGFGEVRKKRFMDAFVKHCNELSDYLQSNICYEGDSDTPVFDKEYNIDILNRKAEHLGMKFDEGMIEY